MSAAASFGPVLESRVPQIEDELGVAVQLNLAGSGTLTKQILEGAPTDLVILAHAQWMVPLTEEGRVDSQRVAEIAGNRLVVVGRGPTISIDQLQDPRFVRIAIGEPTSVPAGHYAEQALRAHGLWDGLHDRLVTTANVRAALRYAISGEVQAAVVYQSDIVGLISSTSEQDLRVLCAIEPTTHDRIVVTAAAVDQSPTGQRMLEWLRSEPAQQRIAEAGFDSTGR